MAYGKLIGAKMYEAPNILNKDGKQYINPTDELYREYGYLPLEYTTIPDIREGYHLVQSWIEIEDKLIQTWNYEADSDLALLQKIQELQAQIEKLQNTFIAPIFYQLGMEVETGKQYTNGQITHMAIADGTPTDFNDINYFD